MARTLQQEFVRVEGDEASREATLLALCSRSYPTCAVRLYVYIFWLGLCIWYYPISSIVLHICPVLDHLPLREDLEGFGVRFIITFKSPKFKKPSISGSMTQRAGTPKLQASEAYEIFTF